MSEASRFSGVHYHNPTRKVEMFQPPELLGMTNSCLVNKRFARWSELEVFERLFEHLSQERDMEHLLIGSTIVVAASDRNSAR